MLSITINQPTLRDTMAAAMDYSPWGCEVVPLYAADCRFDGGVHLGSGYIAGLIWCGVIVLFSHSYSGKTFSAGTPLCSHFLIDSYEKLKWAAHLESPLAPCSFLIAVLRNSFMAE